MFLKKGKIEVTFRRFRRDSKQGHHRKPCGTYEEAVKLAQNYLYDPLVTHIGIKIGEEYDRCWLDNENIPGLLMDKKIQILANKAQH